ncbi:MAG TPA: hypothetical protein VKC66_16135 [Xanthobacteraceae bacterium]|nr:hypothetical protein [Xanthobacteraceae bacterium]
MKLAKFIASISLVLTIAYVAAALAQQTFAAQLAAPNADACDRLAASPYDKARPSGIQGVAFEQVDAPAAIEACRAALEARPDDARLAFQLARALQKDGSAKASDGSGAPLSVGGGSRSRSRAIQSWPVV